MDFFVFIMLIVFNFALSQRITISEEEDLDVGYYWRGYDGNIPEDALPGGKDKNGKTTYIGQTSHGSVCGLTDVVVTGHIYEEEKKMKYEWGYRSQTAYNPIQVLCTRNPEQFEWIETNNADILNLPETNLVNGGREKNYTVYIGRLKTGDEIAVGKVIVTDIYPMEGFYTVLNGDKYHIKTKNQSYEVLAYNPKLSEKKPMASLLQSSNSVGINTTNNLFLMFSLVVSIFSFVTQS